MSLSCRFRCRRRAFHPSANSSRRVKGEYFATSAITGEPVFTRDDTRIDFDWNAASPAPGVPTKTFGVRWTGTLAAPAPGDYTFSVRLADCYPCGDVGGYAVYLDGKRWLKHAHRRGRRTAAYTIRPSRFTLRTQSRMPSILITRISRRSSARAFRWAGCRRSSRCAPSSCDRRKAGRCGDRLRRALAGARRRGDADPREGLRRRRPHRY